MKAPASATGLLVLAVIATVVIGRCAPVDSAHVGNDVRIGHAVAATTTLADGELQATEQREAQQNALAHALAGSPENDPAVAKQRRAARCFYNCPPPVGSVTSSPLAVSMPASGLASVTLHWRWDQSSTQAVSQHGCLWVSRGDESEAHVVECQGPGRTYATTVGWIGLGHYIFRVAPGNPKGPFTKPVAGLFQLAQTIVVGTPQ
jgi:hypothetical protein